MKKKPSVSKSRIKSNLEAKPLTEVISTRAKNKSKTKIANRPQKHVDKTGSDCTNTKTPHVVATKY